MAAWYVYILRCADGSYYIGHTHSLPQRVQAHCDGTAGSFTREHRPVALVFAGPAMDGEAAMQREHQIKRWTRAKKEALLTGDLAHLRALSKSRDWVSPA